MASICVANPRAGKTASFNQNWQFQLGEIKDDSKWRQLNLPHDWRQKEEILKLGPDYQCSAYDNSTAPWGSSHEETWNIVKKNDYLSGMYIWTGWDYLGEPTPFPWPAVSSYFGIIDLAGFPKDPYYFYQSEWTTTPVLHLFPHWNWKPGEKIDVVAYFNNADEVELFLNGRSQGTKRKQGDEMRVFWRLAFEPGLLKAVSRKNGQVVLSREVRTAGPAAKVVVTADRRGIRGTPSSQRGWGGTQFLISITRFTIKV